MKSLYESFTGCSSLTSIEIPTTLIYVSSDKNLFFGNGKGPFENCTNLRDIFFREGTTEIANYICKGSEIENVHIPEGVKIIGQRAFDDCNNIKNIILPEGVEKIYDDAFYCYNLESIFIPKSVNYIGDHVFRNVNTIIYYEGTQDEWKQIGSDYSKYNIIYNYKPENNN